MSLNPTLAPFVRISFTVACVTAIVLVTGSACLAQVAGGTISGSVVDSSGRAIAGAQVAVKNSETAIVRSVNANNDLGGHFKTGQRSGPGHSSFYPVFSC